MSEFLSQWLLTIIAMVITVAFEGSLSGLLGVGGGLIIVSMLYFLQYRLRVLVPQLPCWWLPQHRY